MTRRYGHEQVQKVSPRVESGKAALHGTGDVARLVPAGRRIREVMMKRRILSVAGVLALVIGASVSSFAQDANMRAHVPFAFSVSDSAFPAGDYSLSQLSQNTWIVRNLSGKEAVTAAARPDGTNSDESVAKLVFKKYGERYFLSKVWCEGLTTSIAEPKAERAIEIQMTSNNLKPETVYVLAMAR